MNVLPSNRVSASSGSVSLSAPARLVLVAILVLAALVRLYGLNWDANQHLHPDERFIVMVTMDRISLPFPNLGDGHLGDPRRSTLNPRSADPATGQPRNFAYGSLPLYLLKLSGHLLRPLWPGSEGFDGLTLLGRLLSAIFDLGTILLAFLMARRTYGLLAGLLASLLLSLTVLDIQLSHFYASDTLLTFFLMLTLFLGLRVLEKPSGGRIVLMGMAAGLAMACKVSAAPVLLPVGLACLLANYGIGAGPGERWARALPGAILASLVAGGVFLLFQPYALLDPQPFLRDIQNEGDMVRGISVLPYTIQYLRTPPVVYQVGTLFFWTAGPALTAAAVAGLVAYLVRLFRRRVAAEWVLAGWLVPYLAINLSFQVKFARYMLPVAPILVILAAAGLVALWRRTDSSARSERTAVSEVAAEEQTSAVVGDGHGRLRARLWGSLPALLLLLVLVGTAVQAAGFLSIYSREHTRVEASRWIYDNVPRGAGLGSEHWDDALPLNLSDRPGRQADYRIATLPMYDPDTPDKRRALVQSLSQIDYIVLSSNRLYGSIAKVPESYPMASAYYTLLFQGKLGFDLVATFASYPTVGPLQAVDDMADESFTVYDHPKVLIFKKSPTFSPDRVQQLLGAIPLDRIVPLKQIQSGGSGLLLSEERRAVEEQGGTWSSLYDPDGVTNRLPTLFWWLALELLGLLALPLAWRIFARFPDRGYGLAKVLGLLGVSYLAWLLPSLHLVPFGRLSILLGMAVLGLIGVAVLRAEGGAFRRFYLAHRGVVLVHELLFLGAFALFWFIRVRNPDLWHLNFGGEKPMEFAFLNAVAKSTYFPPYDPWMAGGYINYYYFGYVMVATVMRLTGIVPAVAFNLAIPSIFALTAAGLYSFGFNFVLVSRRLVARALPDRAILAGLATALVVLIAGNLDGPTQVLEALRRLGGLQFKSTLPMVEGTVKALAGVWAVLSGGRVLPAFDFWRSTRIIGPENPTPITEFPYFTFLYGDLHPHMMAMPIATLALGLVLAVVWQGSATRRGDGETKRWGETDDSALSTQHLSGFLEAWARGGRGQAPALHHPGFLRAWARGHDPPSPGRRPAGFLRAWARDWGSLAACGGLVAGALQVTNSWDYPTYLLLLSAAFLLATFARDRALTAKGTLEALLSAVAMYAVAQLLFLPFSRSYELFYNGVNPSPGKTSLQHYLTIFGFFLFCFGSALLFHLARSRRHRLWLRALWERLEGSRRAARRRELSARLVRPTPWSQALQYAVVALVGMALGALLLKLYLVAFLLAMGLLALLALFEKDAPPERLLLTLFVGLGVVLTLGVEFVAIKGDIGRMNTVFKFYLQAWFLFGIASTLGVAGILWQWRDGSKGWLRGWRKGWVAALAALGLSVLIYPADATPVKLAARFHPMAPTLDGMAYMKGASFRDQNQEIVMARDYGAIRWIQDHVAGSPVVLEAQIPEYRWGSRVSIYTGLPTVLGWTWHERQQRWGYQGMIDERLRDVKTMFDTTDVAQLSVLLQKYHVRLIYVGDLERAYYSAVGLAKFDGMVAAGKLSVLYRSDGVTIYSVSGS
ncbi:MAG: DUF2298 domain-containing protein [Chloroflexi bacterium]|nr:DUF2298 domain-containing protein [Chloroflexota bacterium]